MNDHKHRGRMFGGAGAIAPEVRPLDADWQSGEVLIWKFQLPTKVEGFELREPLLGFVLAVEFGGESQLAGNQPIPIESLAQHCAWGEIMSSPARGWKFAGLLLPTLEPGRELKVTLASFVGQIRPYGVQVGGGPRDGGT